MLVYLTIITYHSIRNSSTLSKFYFNKILQFLINLNSNYFLTLVSISKSFCINILVSMNVRK